MLYIKEIKNKEELFNNKYSKLLNYIIYFIKFIFCILTLQDEVKCYIPYKKLKNKYIIRLIVKMLAKQEQYIVLSKSLYNNKAFIEELNKHEVKYAEGSTIFEYNILNIIKYIGKVRNQEIQTMEIHLLINEISELNVQLIQYVSNYIKRVNIITKNIAQFKRIEEKLQDNLGIMILVSNNKKKSLAKADIIINLDFNEEQLNTYNINRSAVIINKRHTEIQSKGFNGVNVRDYCIIFNCEQFKQEYYKEFENKVLLESILDTSKEYKEVIYQLDETNITVTKLIGKNGEIGKSELKR